MRDIKETDPKRNSFDDLVEAGLIENSSQHLHLLDSECEVDTSELESSVPPSPVTPQPKKNSKGRVSITISPDDVLINNSDLGNEVIKVYRSPVPTRRKFRDIRETKSSNYANIPSPRPDLSINHDILAPNSFSDRIKGKFSSMRNPFRRKKSKDYSLKAFVSILFLIILVLVSTISVIHKEKQLQKANYDQIQFKVDDRKFILRNKKGREVLSGIFGHSLTVKDKAWNCLEKNVNESCFEWMNKGRLYFRTLNQEQKRSLGITPEYTHNAYSEILEEKSETDINCYGIYWESLSDSFEIRDCFSIDEKKYFYYGGGEAFRNYPLNTNKLIIPESPFQTGNKIPYTIYEKPDPKSNGNDNESHFEWGKSLSRFFVNSPGAGIKITEDSPLFISLNDHGSEEMLCLSAKKDSFSFPGSDKQKPFLNYTICAGESVMHIATQLADKDIWHGLRHEDAQFSFNLCQTPIWRIYKDTFISVNISEDALLNHTDKISELNLSEGYILLDESWQKHIGDLFLDNEKFPNIIKTLDIMQRRGFKIAFTVQPFFSTESKNYKEGLGLQVWTSEKSRMEEKDEKKKSYYVPALTQFKNTTSTLLDVTNKNASEWLVKKITELGDLYKIDAFFVDLGSSNMLPQHFEFSKVLHSADDYKELFLKSVVQNLPNIPVIGVSSSIKLPKLPTFLSLSPPESTWEGLQTVIYNTLTLGVAGYPFLITGSIGGDVGELPSKELYTRWLLVGHFLPVIQYSRLPSLYGDDVIKIAKSMNFIRKRKLIPKIKETFDNALISGLSIIRPMWMLDPNDINCLRIWNQFVIGNSILVAPVLTENTTEIDIYLPKGIWRDELNGGVTKGQKWIHGFKVPFDKISFFTKISDSAT